MNKHEDLVKGFSVKFGPANALVQKQKL